MSDHDLDLNTLDYDALDFETRDLIEEEHGIQIDRAFEEILGRMARPGVRR